MRPICRVDSTSSAMIMVDNVTTTPHIRWHAVMYAQCRRIQGPRWAGSSPLRSQDRRELSRTGMCSCYLRVLSARVHILQKKNLNPNGFAVQPAPLLPCTCSSLSIPHLRAFNDGLYGPSADLQVRSLASVFLAMIVLTQSILASVLVAMSACVVSVSHALYRTLRRL